MPKEGLSTWPIYDGLGHETGLGSDQFVTNNGQIKDYFST